MKIDSALMEQDLSEYGNAAKRLEDLGYDGGFTFEGPHDPFLPVVSAAAATEKLEMATAVAIGFARTPMLLAQIANDLQLISRGRFILGLGSQIKPHIERRFSMPWSRPAARMREMVLAIRAIWRCWNDGEPLDFQGEFYTHTLMTHIFNPGPNPFGTPRIYLAGVGPKMTETVGEVADGIFIHPLNTAESLDELTLPALRRGLEKSGRSPDEFEISLQLMICSAESDEAMEQARTAVKTQIAFYGSTPAYRPVLDSNGWGELQPELKLMTKTGRWGDMAALISDEMLETIAVCAKPGEIAKAVIARCGGRADRVSLSTPYVSDPGIWADAIVQLKSVS